MEPLDLEEYRQLRATVRERGSLRVLVFVATVIGWALAAALATAFVPLPLAAVLGLTLLVSGFEAVHALHVGVERIGRYLYVRYESGSVPDSRMSNHSSLMWEGAIAAFGAGHRASTRPSDALFSLIFAAAIVANFFTTAPGATRPALAALGALHALAIVRVLFARRAAAGQRAEDQRRFEEVLK